MGLAGKISLPPNIAGATQEMISRFKLLKTRLKFSEGNESDFGQIR